MDELKITMDSDPDGVTIDFSVPVRKLKLSISDARLFAESVLVKVKETETVIVNTEISEWLKAPLDLEATAWLKALAATIDEMQNTGSISTTYNSALTNVRLLVNEPAMIDQLNEFVVQMFDTNAIRKVVTRNEDEAKKMIAFLDWIAALPTVPPPS